MEDEVVIITVSSVVFVVIGNSSGSNQLQNTHASLFYRKLFCLLIG